MLLIMFSRYLQNTKSIISLSNSFLNKRQQQIMHMNTFFKQNSEYKVIWNNIPKTAKNKFVPITTLHQFRKFSNSKGITYN
jgi:hypothetical protein